MTPEERHSKKRPTRKAVPWWRGGGHPGLNPASALEKKKS